MGRAKSTDVLFYFVLFDTLFLPYFWLLSIPFSMPLVFYWAYKRNNLYINTKDGKYLGILLASMVVATFAGVLLNGASVYENLKLIILFAYVFLTFFFFKHYFSENTPRVEWMLDVFALFVLVVVAVYFFDKSVYERLVDIWNSRSGGTFAKTYYNLEGYRFSFFWTDPNNIAYMITCITVFRFTYFKLRFIQALLWEFVTVLVLIASMSRGGLLAAAVAFSVFIFFGSFSRKCGSKKHKLAVSKLALVNYIFLMALVFYLLLDSGIIRTLEENLTIAESLDRLSMSDDTRMMKWNFILAAMGGWDYVFHLFAGYGAGSFVDGIATSPHNGHIFWILNYGLISYIVLILFLFRFRPGVTLRGIIWIIPFFIGFSLNIMIGEAKLFVIFMLMLAYTDAYGKQMLVKNRNIQFRNQTGAPDFDLKSQ